MSQKKSTDPDLTGFLNERRRTSDVGGGAEITDYATYDSLPSSGEYATLNRVAMWRDTNTAGSIWVPAYLRNWTLETSWHGDTVALGALPAGWATGVVGAGTVTMVSNRVRCDSANTSDLDYGLIQYIFPALGAAADIVVICRTQIVNPSVTVAHACRAPEIGDLRGTDTAAFLSPDFGGVMGWYASDPGTAVAGGSAANQTGLKVYEIRKPVGATVNQLITARVLEDTALVAHCRAVEVTIGAIGSSNIFFMARRFTDQVVVDVEFCAIYVKG